MALISVLDAKTIDQISAGEVVERPSSVVKELTENAIDAGAGAISIEIKDGGVAMIRITDDGCGIAPEDLPTAFLPHATSKLHSITDLDDLATLGFRGEALSSIASVSRVEMITKTADELSACRCRIDGGKLLGIDDIGAPNGTTIIVRDLFYNIPARAKFLKSAMTEASYIGTYVEQLALSHPGIAFSFTVNGSVKLETSGSGSLKDVIYKLYGRDVVKELIPLNFHDEGRGIDISGFIARPVVSRGNRHFENYYVNGRYVKNRVVMKAIEDGYGNKLMQHQYPFTCFAIDIDGRKVDINVHPTKMEVRFSEETVLYELLRNLITEALSSQEMILRPSLDAKASKPAVEKPQKKVPEPFEKKAREDGLACIRESAPTYPAMAVNTQHVPQTEGTTERAKTFAESFVVTADKTPPVPTDKSVMENKSRTAEESEHTMPAKPCNAEVPPTEPIAAAKAENESFEQMTFGFLTEEARKTSRIVGQCFDTYWIVEYNGSLFIIDQHAAHEKVLYEQFMAKYRERKLASQQISPPLIVTLTSLEESLLKEHKNAFEELGFVIEHFGGHDYAVRAVPYTLEALGTKKLFIEILDHLEDAPRIEDMDIYTHRVATEACKAAVKGHDKISFSEAQHLIDTLLTLDDPYHCPHGRPTIIAFTQKELEKKFKRVL